MANLVARLRQWDYAVANEAADEIRSLQAALKRVERIASTGMDPWRALSRITSVTQSALHASKKATDWQGCHKPQCTCCYCMDRNG